MGGVYLMAEFNVEEFLVREMKDLNRKLDDNTDTLNSNINELKTCIHNKVNEVRTDVNKKFETHAALHLSNAKSFISTKIFLFAMVILLGCVGYVFTLSSDNKNDITDIKAKQEVQKVEKEDENRLSIENKNK